MMRIPRIYFDLDGVLADFAGGSMRVHGKSLPPLEVTWDFPQQIGFETTGCPKFWEPLGNVDFWANLDVLPDGRELFERVADAVPMEALGVLSSGLCPGSQDGKRLWLKKHFPALEKVALFGARKEYAAAPCKILVDDHYPNIEAFNRAGGYSVIVPRPWNILRDRVNEDGHFNPVHVADEVISTFKFLA